MGAVVRPLTLVTVAGVAVAAVLLPVATTARLHLGGADRWLPFGYAVLVAVAGFAIAYRRAARTPDGIPFAAVAAAETAGLVGLVALFYPQLVPPSVTLYSAAASRETLVFLVIAIGVIGPVTIAYHAYANWVFRGRQPVNDDAVRGGRAAASTAIPDPRPAEGGL